MQICVDGMDDDNTPIPSPTAPTPSKTAAAAATSLPHDESASISSAATGEARCLQRPNHNHIIRPISFSVDNILAPGRDDDGFPFHT